MNWTLLGVIVLAVLVIVAPLITLRVISRRQVRRETVHVKPLADDDDDPDKPSGFW